MRIGENRTCKLEIDDRSAGVPTQLRAKPCDARIELDTGAEQEQVSLKAREPKDCAHVSDSALLSVCNRLGRCRRRGLSPGRVLEEHAQTFQMRRQYGLISLQPIELCCACAIDRVHTVIVTRGESNCPATSCSRLSAPST